MRSAITPNNTPPNAEASRVAEAIAPAAAELRWNSSRMVVSANAYSMTSMASSIQANCAAASVVHCARVMELYQGMEPLLLRLEERERRVDGDLLETHPVARAELPDRVKLGCNHVRDFGITAGGLVLHKEDDGLPVRRRLDRAQRHSFGEHVARVTIERRPAQAKPHTVGVFLHFPGGAAEGVGVGGGGYVDDGGSRSGTKSPAQANGPAPHGLQNVAAFECAAFKAAQSG